MNRKILSELIITHDLSVLKIQFFFNEECRNISRSMTKYDVMKKYEIKKEKLKQQLAKFPIRVCLSFDCWIACTNISYISLTTHYVEK